MSSDSTTAGLPGTIAHIAYGKANVSFYRTYAAPLVGVTPIPESAFTGRPNVLFAYDVEVEVLDQTLAPAYTEGDNSLVIATDTMKNFAHRGRWLLPEIPHDRKNRLLVRLRSRALHRSYRCGLDLLRACESVRLPTPIRSDACAQKRLRKRFQTPLSRAWKNPDQVRGLELHPIDLEQDHETVSGGVEGRGACAMTKLRVLDLFSGIGGFSLGLERTGGFETVAFCEIEEYPRRVLAKHWPRVPCYHDVRDLTADALARDGIAVDVICGGFPCQDISFAGKGAGLAGERSGLWFHYARLIGELRPAYVIVENVAALLSRGLADVLGSLASLGYGAEWHCIPASAVGAPHRRDRLWIVAYPGSEQHEGDCAPISREIACWRCTSAA